MRRCDCTGHGLRCQTVRGRFLHCSRCSSRSANLLRAREVVKAGGLVNPAAVLMPTCLDLRDAETAMALLTRLLGARPLKQVVRGTANARGGSKRAEAVLAALLLIME